MLAETGDNAFRLGHVDQDSYNSLILSDKLIGAISSSLTQCAPECSTCVYESHCGADPVSYGSVRGARGNSRPYREKHMLASSFSGFGPQTDINLPGRDRPEGRLPRRQRPAHSGLPNQ